MLIIMFKIKKTAIIPTPHHTTTSIFNLINNVAAENVFDKNCISFVSRSIDTTVVVVVGVVGEDVVSKAQYYYISTGLYMCVV